MPFQHLVDFAGNVERVHYLLASAVCVIVEHAHHRGKTIGQRAMWSVRL